MRLIFAGTPGFAAIALEALAAAGHEIALVLTQPDRVAGRGLRLRASAVKESALALGLQLLQPSSLRAPEIQRELHDANGEVMIVAAYGLILPAEVLATPARGCLNIHASLLPRWRGAAPIQRALLAGDRETGISIMQMDAGLDTGPVLLQESLAIANDDTAHSLHDRLAALGARCVLHALEHRLEARMQDAAAATYAAKITKAEAQIDWSCPAPAISRQVRAFNPDPGAATTLDGARLKIWRAQPLGGPAGPPGTVLAADAGGIVVGAGEGALFIQEVQPAGGKRLTAAAFLAGRAVALGTRLGG